MEWELRSYAGRTVPVTFQVKVGLPFHTAAGCMVHRSHISHCTPLWLDLTGLEQTVQGYLHLLGGPGLSSTSPESTSIYDVSILSSGAFHSTSPRCEGFLTMATRFTID